MTYYARAPSMGMTDQLRDRAPGNRAHHVPIVRLVLRVVAVPIPKAVNFLGPLALDGLAEGGVLARAAWGTRSGGRGGGDESRKGQQRKQEMEKQRAAMLPPWTGCGHV